VFESVEEGMQTAAKTYKQGAENAHTDGGKAIAAAAAAFERGRFYLEGDFNDEVSRVGSTIALIIALIIAFINKFTRICLCYQTLAFRRYLAGDFQRRGVAGRFNHCFNHSFHQ
jgi:hypothetical protein